MQQERFYRDTYAVLSNVDFILLRVEFLLLYKKLIPNLLLLLTGFDMTSEVGIALQRREIFSVEELSFHAAKGFRIFLKVINLFAPYREQRPLLVRILSREIYIIACILTQLSGLLLIWIGLIAKEHNLTYFVVNVFLIVPGLMHHRIFSRTWSVLKPYVDQIEAEFDRGQIESVAEREAGERELWEPLATSSFFHQPERRYEGSPGRFDTFDVDVDDYDASESQFIQSFIPHRLKLSKEKNKVALDAMTREIMETCRNQEEIDEWFSEVTQDPKHPEKRTRSASMTENRTGGTGHSSPNATSGAAGDHTFNSELDSAAWEEFSVSYLRHCFNLCSSAFFNDSVPQVNGAMVILDDLINMQIGDATVSTPKRQVIHIQVFLVI
ncbi:unnamed protein product [Hydatigera taeniaeformis]|uniref:RGS domain-containing protein n=1 Tax=Hydatigena taeniaeformis TaxID=6205 RepID=A0A0R3XB34_HYDTA|nr:unnamed protein product [Hydatigera taeniaeformis]